MTSKYVDDAAERAKTSRPPLRMVLPPEPDQAECRVLLSVIWHASLLESRGKKGDLAAFAKRLREQLLTIEEALLK